MRRREFREMMDKIEEEHRLHRGELRAHQDGLRAHQDEVRALRDDQKRRFDAIDAAMANDRRVTREIVLELREGRATLRDMRHGIQANTERLLRVLDEFRRDDGPSSARA